MNFSSLKILSSSGSILIGLILIYVGFVFVIYLFQSHFIFFPQKELEQALAEIGLEFENVTFASSDHVMLQGWFISAKDPVGAVLFCHGNAGNISHRLASIKTFLRLDLSVFIFDYRGYGQSQGKMTEKGAYLDAETAWNYLVEEKKINPQNIIIFGRSMGGSIATWLAQNKKQAALIIESTFTSTKDLAVKHYPFLPVQLLLKFKFETINYIRNVTSPALIIHSEHDEIVPFVQGQKLYETANEPKEFLAIHGGHNDGFFISEPEYSKQLNMFVKNI